MSKIYTTLHPQNDESVEIYPNIESQNIPSRGVTGEKIANGSVSEDKLDTTLKNKINGKADKNELPDYDKQSDTLTVENVLYGQTHINLETKIDDLEDELDGKANTNNVYAKSETYSKNEVNGLLENKADSSNVYSKSEIYTKTEVNNYVQNKFNDYIFNVDIRDDEIYQHDSFDKLFMAINEKDSKEFDNFKVRIIFGAQYLNDVYHSILPLVNIDQVDTTVTYTFQNEDYYVTVVQTGFSDETFTITWGEVSNDYYTKSQTDTLLNGKQSVLTTSSVGDGVIDKNIGFDNQGNIVKQTGSLSHLYLHYLVISDTDGNYTGINVYFLSNSNREIIDWNGLRYFLTNNLVLTYLWPTIYSELVSTSDEYYNVMVTRIYYLTSTGNPWNIEFYKTNNSGDFVLQSTDINTNLLNVFEQDIIQLI